MNNILQLIILLSYGISLYFCYRFVMLKLATERKTFSRRFLRLNGTIKKLRLEIAQLKAMHIKQVGGGEGDSAGKSPNPSINMENRYIKTMKEVAQVNGVDVKPNER